jgi:acyl-CoA thioester hydrolase
MGPMEGYRFVRRRTVEFRDVDTAGHVNNAVYLTYLETARIDYLREVLRVESLDDLAVIVANVNVDFRSPARFAEVLEIGTRVPRLGTKSFTMEHEVRAADARLVAEAPSVLVAYDYGAGTAVPIPDQWRNRVEAYEERSSVTA